MKVFYQKQTWQALKPGEPESASIEDVEFPVDLYEELEKGLERSQRLLPPTAKKFQGWDVGLLERFEVLEAGLGDGSGEQDEAGENGSANGNGVGVEIPEEDVD